MCCFQLIYEPYRRHFVFADSLGGFSAIVPGLFLGRWLVFVCYTKLVVFYNCLEFSVDAASGLIVFTLVKRNANRLCVAQYAYRHIYYSLACLISEKCF